MLWLREIRDHEKLRNLGLSERRLGDLWYGSAHHVGQRVFVVRSHELSRFLEKSPSMWCGLFRGTYLVLSVRLVGLTCVLCVASCF